MAKMKMEFNDSSLLATMNPLLLIGGMLVALAVAWICAVCYRNTNDFKKSVRLYGIVAAVLFLVVWLLGVPVVMGVGLVICGFVFLALFSNYYFYH